MGDDELAEIRRKRMSQMQQQAVDQQMMQEEMDRQKQADAQLHMLLLQILEPEARERLNAIRLTRPDFARSVEQQLVLLAQSGRLKQKINDAQLKALLQQIQPARKEFNIRRKG
jgi:programmed cell death protein 5